MSLERKTLEELKIILKEEFNYEPNKKELINLAHSLIGYYDLLLKINNRNEVRKSSYPPY